MGITAARTQSTFERFCIIPLCLTVCVLCSSRTIFVQSMLYLFTETEIDGAFKLERMKEKREKKTWGARKNNHPYL